MKLKFRRGKLPLKVMTRGDQKPRPPKPLKSAAALEAVETPIAQLVQLVEDKIVAARVVPICPLCRQPFTIKDFVENKTIVTLNRVLYTVHKKCPTNQV